GVANGTVEHAGSSGDELPHGVGALRAGRLAGVLWRPSKTRRERVLRHIPVGEEKVEPCRERYSSNYSTCSIPMSSKLPWSIESFMNGLRVSSSGTTRKTRLRLRTKPSTGWAGEQ